MKKLLILTVTLMILVGCSRKEEQVEKQYVYDDVSKVLATMSAEEIKSYCSENEIPLKIIHEESDETPAEEMIRLDTYVDDISGEEIPMIVFSSGYKSLYVSSSLGVDRGNMDITTENLKTEYKVYDYAYEFEDGCEDDISCIVVNQSLKDETIKEPTVITYIFGKDPSKFGYIHPTEYLGYSEERFIKALNDLGYTNLKKVDEVYSNFRKGNICYYLPDGNREYTDTIEYKVSLGLKPVQPTTPSASSNSNNTTNNNTSDVPSNSGDTTSGSTNTDTPSVNPPATDNPQPSQPPQQENKPTGGVSVEIDIPTKEEYINSGAEILPNPPDAEFNPDWFN